MPKENIYALSTAPAVYDAATGLWEKELIYAGDFQKRELDGTVHEFSVNEPILDHWNRTHAEMRAAGIEVPMPIEHTKDPEKRRGSWEKTARKDAMHDGKMVPALFGYAKFRDKEAEKLALSANVSIFVPEALEVNGKRWPFPIEHIALTDYPAIPGLGPFKQALMCSTTSPPIPPPTPTKQEKKKMPLADIAAALDVEVGDKDDAALEAAIITAIKKMNEDVEDVEDTEEEDAPAPAVAASLICMGRDNRTMKIDRLVDQLKITPAVAAELKKDYCNDKTLQLSLSGKADDGFDRVIKTHEMNEPRSGGKSKTGPQGSGKSLALSDPLKGSDNPLMRDAEARSKK